MPDYPFFVVKYDQEPRNDFQWMETRPLADFSDDLKKGARLFIPGEKMEIAINTAIAVGSPLLVTGEPGTGKTQIAYYIAYKLNIEPVLHFQVKSISKAQDLFYSFDTIRCFHDAQFDKSGYDISKKKYIKRGPLWKAIEGDRPSVLLIDEVDKAPRDFPNDILHEIDQMSFEVPDLDIPPITGNKRNRPIIIMTSNSERRLPEPFLRRCIFHYIKFDEALITKIVEKRRKTDYPSLSKEFLTLAVKRFMSLRKLNLRKNPATGELLTWLRIIDSAPEINSKEFISEDLSQIPHPEALIKDRLDMEKVMGEGMVKTSENLNEW